jgi:hypothetical protein
MKPDLKFLDKLSHTVVTFWILLTLVLTSCGTEPKPNQFEVEMIHTLVAQAIEETRAVQTQQMGQAFKMTESIQALIPTATCTPTNTALPTDTPTPTPSYTPSETPTLTPSSAPTNAGAGVIPENAIIFYLTLVGTGGSVGCGDSLLKMTTGQVRSGDVAADLKVALGAIFNAGQYTGATYNAVYPSRLSVDRIEITLDGTAVVNFSGSYEKPANSCDASRYRSQVWGTALQFKEIKRFEPWVGNALLGDRLSVYSDSGK